PNRRNGFFSAHPIHRYCSQPKRRRPSLRETVVTGETKADEFLAPLNCRLDTKFDFIRGGMRQPRRSVPCEYQDDSVRKMPAIKRKARQAEASAKSAHHQLSGVSVASCANRCGCAGSGVPMSKHEPRSPLASGGASVVPSRERSGVSKLATARSPALGEIGFVGLGRMGAAMAANLAAKGRQVIAYVRRPDRVGELEALGLRPTTDIGDLLHCDVVISMLPDDEVVREVVFGRREIGLDGLAAGLMPGAIHLSMSTISTAAASL